MLANREIAIHHDLTISKIPPLRGVNAARAVGAEVNLSGYTYSVASLHVFTPPKDVKNIIDSKGSGMDIARASHPDIQRDNMCPESRCVERLLVVPARKVCTDSRRRLNWRA